MPPLEDPKHADLWIFGGAGAAALAVLSPDEWYAHLGFLWNIYHANIEGTVVPVRAALAAAALALVWGFYLKSKRSS